MNQQQPNTGRKRANAISLIHTPPRRSHSQEMARIFRQASARPLWNPRCGAARLSLAGVALGQENHSSRRELSHKADKISSIELWLDSVVESTPETSSSCLKAQDAYPMIHEEFKSRKPLAASEGYRGTASSISQRRVTHMVNTKASRFAKIPVQSSALRRPPRRFHPGSSSTESGGVKREESQSRLIKSNWGSRKEMDSLSPNIQRHRKHDRYPRRRCGSYYDEDILPRLSPKPSTRCEVTTTNFARDNDYYSSSFSEHSASR